MSAGQLAGICLERKTMTRLYIDKQEVAPLPSDLSSLDEVLRLVESSHLPSNVVIHQVQVDGIPLIQNEESNRFSEHIRGQEKIEIFTSTLREVAIESIREAIAYLERAEAATHSLASSLRTQVESEAAANLKQFYEGFYCINLLLDRLEQSFRIPYEDVRIRSGSAREYCTQMASLLKEVIEAHEHKDFGLLADLLEYEVAALMPACKEVFAAVRSRILAEQ
jgi:hypothetical protein